MKRKLQLDKQIQSDAKTVSITSAENKVMVETGISPELAFADRPHSKICMAVVPPPLILIDMCWLYHK